MKKALFLAGLLLPTLILGTVEAHGGVYVPPPAPNVPTMKSGIPDPTKPPSYGGSPINSPGTPGPGSPMTPGGMIDFGVDRTRWTWWWEFHRAGYLDLRSHVLADDPASGGGEFLGHSTSASAVLVPTAARIRNEVLPPLLAVLRTERNTDLVSSALIALARIGDELDEADQALVIDAIRPFLADSSHELAEAATLSLGILGTPSNAPLLAAIARDDSVGRKAVGDTSIPTRMRSAAAYGLGLLASQSDREDVRRYAVHELARVLDAERGSTHGDLESACVLAVGLIPLAVEAAPAEGDEARPPAAGRSAQLAYLEEVLRDRRRNDVVRAQVPISLARLAAAPAQNLLETRADELRERTAKTLLDRLAPMRREPNGVVQSSVVGLGLLIDNDDDERDVEARRKLRFLDSDHRDRGARRFARIALAQIAARPGTGEPDGVDEVRRFLLTELAKGRGDERAWAALSLGILERGRLDRGLIPDTGVASALRDSLSTQKAPDDVGACAVALGLMRDISAEPVLLARMRQVNDDEAKGHLALALGMIGARSRTPELQRLVDASGYRPLILRESATGLALLGDKTTLPKLLDALRDSRSLASQAALAEAIGRVGDARSFADLAEILADKSVPSTARAFSAVAIGLAADLDRLPWSTPLAVHGNHLTAPVTLYDDVGLGVLNLL